jgi:hypothetical protein
MCEDLNIAVPLYVQKQIFPLCSKSSQRKKSAPKALTVGQFAELLVRCAHYLTEVNVTLKKAGKLMTADETEVAPCLRALLRTRFLSWSRLNTPDSFRVEIFRSPQVEAAMSQLKRAVEHRFACRSLARSASLTGMDCCTVLCTAKWASWYDEMQRIRPDCGVNGISCGDIVAFFQRVRPKLASRESTLLRSYSPVRRC